jgi:hypothetical protein
MKRGFLGLDPDRTISFSDGSMALRIKPGCSAVTTARRKLPSARPSDKAKTPSATASASTLAGPALDFSPATNAEKQLADRNVATTECLRRVLAVDPGMRRLRRGAGIRRRQCNYP